MKDRLQNDSGFTVAELIVALTVGLIVLGIMYTIMDGAQAAYNRVETGTRENRSASHALSTVTRYLRELQNLNHAEDYSIDFTADIDNDGVLDRFVYQIDAEDRLIETLSNPNTGAPIGTRVVAANVRNKTSGIPLFRYWKGVGTPAAGNAAYSPPKDGERLTKTQLISVELSSHVDRGPVHSPLTLRTDVYLRNKLY